MLRQEVEGHITLSQKMTTKASSPSNPKEALTKHSESQIMNMNEGRIKQK